MPIVFFVAWTLFCAWVVFGEGAETLEGWKASVFLEWWAGLLDASQLRVYVAVSWLVTVGGLVWTHVHRG